MSRRAQRRRRRQCPRGDLPPRSPTPSPRSRTSSSPARRRLRRLRRARPPSPRQCPGWRRPPPRRRWPLRSATSPAPVSPAPAGTAAPKPSPPPAAPRQGPPPSADRPRAATPPEPATLAALADRALDPDPDVAAAACAALGNRRRDPAARQAAEKLRRALLSGISARASRAALAIGALRDADAIPLLIQVLETSEPETARLSADALAAITLQRLGPDARRWLGWWKENRGRGRAEWLFSGLTSADRETRVAASVELSSAAPPPVECLHARPAVRGAQKQGGARLGRLVVPLRPRPLTVNEP